MKKKKDKVADWISQIPFRKPVVETHGLVWRAHQGHPFHDPFQEQAYPMPATANIKLAK